MIGTVMPSVIYDDRSEALKAVGLEGQASS